MAGGTRSSMQVALGLVMLTSFAVACNAFTFDKNARTLQSAMGGVHPFQAFNAWQLKHGKSYRNQEELQMRFDVWLRNAQKVVDLNNKAGRKIKLGLNGLADLTTDEFKSKMVMTMTIQPTVGKERTPVDPQEASANAVQKKTDFHWRYETIKPKDHVDWRAAGIMGPVRSQHAHNYSCGGCWAFAAVGIVEASSALYNGKVIPGSEQQLIDCDDKHDHGCNGGDFHNALDYVIYNKGLTTEDRYPYKGKTKSCDQRKEKDHAVKIDDWESVPPFNETALIQALTMRPVVTAICCGSNIDDWHHYDGGVFDLPCCHDELALDHAVVLVGYGTTEQGEPYYIMKNSWSEEWGEGGYMRLARNVGPPQAPFVSQCGLASMPTMVFRGPKPEAPDSDSDNTNSGVKMINLDKQATQRKMK